MNPDICPVCGYVHYQYTPPMPCDYETCGECGYDHEYEFQEAAHWHEVNDDPEWDPSWPEREES